MKAKRKTRTKYQVWKSEFLAHCKDYGIKTDTKSLRRLYNEGLKPIDAVMRLIESNLT